MIKMNQLFVCVVVLCAVLVSSYYFIKINKRDKKITIMPLKSSGNLTNSFNNYDSISNMYSSSKNLNVLTNTESQLHMCNQQTALIDAEINTLQSRLTEKKQQNAISCQNKLKIKLDIDKKLHRSLNGIDMSSDELAELENKIGFEKQT
jgi:hypothetical protein